MVAARESTIAEKDTIITSLQKQVQDGRQELKKQIDLMNAEKSHTKEICSPYIQKISEKDAQIDGL